MAIFFLTYWCKCEDLGICPTLAMSFQKTTPLSNLDHRLQKRERAIHILSGKCDIEASQKL